MRNGVAEGESKPAGHYSYDDVGFSIQLDDCADNVRVAAVGGPPHGIAEDQAVGLTGENGTVALSLKVATESRMHP
jgi:hypothetical protein